MRAFITGASGFIGGHLVERLLENKWQIRALIHQQRIPSQENIEVIKGDIRDLRLLQEALKGTDILFHLASALGSSLISHKEFLAINAQGTQNVLQAAGRAGVQRIVHFSSAGVLGAVRDSEAADENYLLNPQNIYDTSKLEGEKIARTMANQGLDVVIIRPGWAYGPRDRRTFKLIKAVHQRRFALIGKGRTLQTPVHIQDLIQGTLLCAERGKRGEIYHLAGKEILTVKEIAEAIAGATGKKLLPLSLPLLPVKWAAGVMGILYSVFKKEAPLNPAKLSFFIHPKPLAIQKAVRQLGYAPAVDFKDGIALTVRWYRENGWL
ncbi:MAG: NAD-dependent epimerase/dehydratase family protein [Candidatus Aminicenantales bacterium]